MQDFYLERATRAMEAGLGRRSGHKSPMSERTMAEFGKLLLIVGVVLVVAGLGRTHLPIGRLSGDIFYRGKNATVYLPLATSLLLSVALSLVLYLINRFRR
jgi:hypothetical protein